MAIVPTQLARVSNLLRTNVAHQAISRTQERLLKTQMELATGRRLNVPSDSPGESAIVQQMRKTMERREAYAVNLRHAAQHLGESDVALEGLGNILLEAQQIASANVGSDVTHEQRQAAAQIVKTLYQQAVELGNRQANGMFLFGGDQVAQPPFVEGPGGLRFAGSTNVLANRYDDHAVLPFMVDGSEVFGALSARMQGADVGAELTGLTALAELRGGTGIDQSGLVIRNGELSATIDLSSAVTVEDLLNAINGVGVGVLARINGSGTGIDVLNAMQGTRLSIGENGGSAAEELGLRSFSPETLLAELNGGRGVGTVDGADLRVTRADGTSFEVNLSGTVTVQDVIDAINAADGGAGVTASLATAGNGIVLTDSTVGGGVLNVSGINGSGAATDLGLVKSASGGVIVGEDVNAIRPAGVFAHLSALLEAMQRDDQAGMTEAAQGLQEDFDRITRIRGETGARVRDLESRHERLEDQSIAAQAMLSALEDTDYTEAIMRFQTLQASLQASLQTTGRMLNLSLLDFLA
jgi:flagellin-like hook-associated protein FlgL